MKEEIKNLQNCLMRKKSIKNKVENNLNNNIHKDKVVPKEINNDKISIKDKAAFFETVKKENNKNIEKFKNKGKDPPKKVNNNNKEIINSINKNDINITKKNPKKLKNPSKSLNKNLKLSEEIILDLIPTRHPFSIHILHMKRIDLNNISTYYKKNISKKESEDFCETIKINDYQKTIRNKTLSSIKINDKNEGKNRKKNSLVDENFKLVIKLKSKKNYKKEDFEILNYLGKGAYGTVLQVKLLKEPKNNIYAIKKLDIGSLLSVNRLYQAYLENDILSELNCPYIVKVYGAFEADEKIHLVMDYMPKGDFAYFIKQNYPLRPDVIRFYAAEMFSCLEYMQKMKLIHRDLKPQNIMIDEKGHLKIIDFGTVRKKGYYYDKREMKFKEEKIFEVIDSEDIKGVKNVINPDEEDVDEDDEEEEENDDEEEDKNNNSQKKLKVRCQRSMTFVGTAEYISPEVIADKPADYGTDIWAVGVMIYQMIFNTTPFLAATNYLTFRKIESAVFEFPKDSNDISEEAKDLLKKIFIIDPKKRLGGGDPGTEFDMEHLKKHKFFKNIKWNNLYNITPPGFEQNKFYESKRKSIYKKKENAKSGSDGYAVFDDKSNDDSVKIIKEGYIKKKSSWFTYEKKYIILDTTPRIVVVNLNENGNKKAIPLTKNCKVSLVDNNCFDLKTPQKNHRFKGLSNDGNDWAGLIDDVIKGYAKE